MASPKQKKKRKKKKSLIRKFFGIVFSILLVYIVAFGSYIVYTYLNDNDNDDWFANNPTMIPSSLIPKVPERTSFLIMGLDNEKTRTDVMMVGCFNSITKQLNIISLPRDTLVKIPSDRYQALKDNGSHIKSPEVKLNEVHSYAGKSLNTEYTIKQIEDLLDIDLDYYAKVDLEAFRYIVDSIGGIEFDVQDRLYYSDPTQDLYIDLKPGLQTLDGDKAEQLVRYRKGYIQQDLKRVEVQQDFMREFISQALDKQTIMSNPTAYLSAMFKYVDTNIGITDALKYLKYLDGFSSESITTYTLPGEPENLPTGSYFIYDEEETTKLIYDIFQKPSSEIYQEENSSSSDEPSTEKQIQVLNGGYTSGLAGKTKESLEKNGFTISNIGDYSGEKKEPTRIYVKKEGQGKDLEKYFTESEIIVDSDETKEYDIVIILGTKEKIRSESDE